MPQSENRQCQNCKKEFLIEPEDFAFYEKIKVPAPTFCPACREQRRLAFRNERALYKRKCDLCGESVVSRVSPDKPYPMYCQKCWWSDKWDSLKYGREYDFSRPFFEQFKELWLSVPHLGIFNANVVNSEWVNQETDDKNCYLNVGGHYNEDSAYNTYEIRGKNCFDSFWLLNSELCYENINCERCYRTLFSHQCFDCVDVILSNDCRNCNNVFGCVGLRSKQYYIFNKPYSKEEYQEFLKKNSFSSQSNLARLMKEAEAVWLSMPRRDVFIVKSINSTGYFINESKNAKNGWNAEKAEDSKNLYIVGYVKDCYDLSAFGWGELLYEVSSSVGLYNSKFVLYSGSGEAERVQSSYLEYCAAVMMSSYCFGCVNLRNQQYCILNKKYSKEEYEQLIPRIREQMETKPYVDKKGRIYKYGEHFPIELSPFGYNETVANEYFPLTREEALAKGYPWSDYELETKYGFSDYQIPDDIKDAKDDILDKILKCEVSGKAYRIIPIELQFYRRMGLPIPRRAPLQRHKDRMARLLPRKLFDRTCQRCAKKIQTPYASECPEIVYCEQCYQSEIY